MSLSCCSSRSPPASPIPSSPAPTPSSTSSLPAPSGPASIVYTSGLAALLLFQAITRGAFPDSAKLHAVPWWAWLGGLVSIISTVVGLTIAQRLGSGVFTGASVTAALVTSVALDHFGLIGFKQHTASPLRLTGCAIMIAGLWMVARF